MIQKVTMYQAVCAGCGEICADSWTTAWESPASAKYFALESDWCEIDGKLYCPDCVEYDEETDSYKPKNKEELL